MSSGGGWTANANTPQSIPGSVDEEASLRQQKLLKQVVYYTQCSLIGVCSIIMYSIVLDKTDATRSCALLQR